MSFEMPKNYEDILKEEVARIIKTYPERLKNASSILDETQKIVEEEEITDPKLKKDLPLEVTGTIRKIGKYKTFKDIKSDKLIDPMSRYAEEARRDSYFIEKREQKD